MPIPPEPGQGFVAASMRRVWWHRRMDGTNATHLALVLLLTLPLGLQPPCCEQAQAAAERPTRRRT